MIMNDYKKANLYLTLLDLSSLQLHILQCKYKDSIQIISETGALISCILCPCYHSFIETLRIQENICAKVSQMDGSDLNPLSMVSC